MSIIHATRPSVKPVSAPRMANGRFASAAALAMILTVSLPNGRTGYQVGPLGRIYASAIQARQYATYRAHLETARIDAMAIAASEADEFDRWTSNGHFPI